MFFYFRQFIMVCLLCFILVATPLIALNEGSYDVWDSSEKIDFEDEDVIILEEGDNYILVKVNGKIYYFEK